MAARRRFNPADQMDQLDLAMPETAASSEPGRLTRPRSVDFSRCPRCLIKRIGLVRVGRHFVYREHMRTTWSGARLPCQASGVAVCDLPSGRTACTCGSPHAG